MSSLLPDDYYLSDQENLPYDSDYGITQPRGPCFGDEATAELSTTETDSSFGPPPNEAFIRQQNGTARRESTPAGSFDVDQEEEHRSVVVRGRDESAEGRDGEYDEHSNSEEPEVPLLPFSVNSLLYTPPWARAEEAGMSQISIWRQTCNISPSRRPPPSRHPRGAVSRSDLPTESASSTPDRPPLRTLYERDPYLVEPEYREMRDIGCNTEALKPALAEAGCQTDQLEVPVLDPYPPVPPLPTAASDPFPDWLDSALVSAELEQGRESRLRQYVKRFRYSAVNAYAEHRRAFQLESQATPVTPSRKRRHSLNGLPVSGTPAPPSPLEGVGKRARYKRQTKIQAKDKIKSCFEPGGILDSQIDSQVWLDRSFATSGPSSSPTAVSEPSTPHREQKLLITTTPTSHVSPFTLHVPDGRTPRKFTAQDIPTDPSHWQPNGIKEFTYEELDWLTEFYLRTNALLTEDMINLHVRLHRAEDMARGFRQFIDQYLKK